MGRVRRLIEELDEPDSTTHSITTDGPASADDERRQQAVRQIERRRRYQLAIGVASLGMAVLVFIWAIAEYQNAGGWPTNGFSQSSGIHDTWNYWIIYPFIAYLVFIAARTWVYYRHKPISESEIEREMTRQSGRR